MATSVNKNTFSSTYKDDYLDSDGYYRILFNSGKKLQARELTQMQTILQKQIERMGNNLFKDGTPILFGGHSVDNRYEFIQLDDALSNIPADTNTIVGETYVGTTSQVQFEILEVVAATGSDPTTLYVRYTSTKNSAEAIAGNDTTVRALSGEPLTSAGNPGLRVKAATGVVGSGSRFTLGQSIYYTKGFFVFVEPTALIISKYSNEPTVDVVLKINETTVSASDDDGLFDNQGSVPNVTAPGADRYKIILTLADKATLAASDNYFEIANVKDGTIITRTEVTDSYKIPNDLINLRIHENSGNYVVSPFTSTWEEDSDQNFLRLTLSDGIAVVAGARISAGLNSSYRISKSNSTVSENDELVPTRFGNYVDVPEAEIFGMPNLSQFDSQTIMDDSDFVGNAIGSCKVRYITQDGADRRYYLFDINMNTGKDFRDTKSIGTSTTNYFNPTTVGGKVERLDATLNNLLFKLPFTRPKQLSNADITVQRYFNQSTLNGQIVINTSGSEVFVDDDEWLVTDSSGVLSPTITPGAGNSQATITGLPDGNGTVSQTINIAAYVRKPNVNKLTKTLTTKFVDGLVESNGEGVKFVDLHRADVYDLDRILETGDSTNDFTASFTLDNGQRDNYYAKGRVILKPGLTVPTPGDAGGAGLRVFYRYFAHTGNGSYFDVGSYGDLDYKDIPDYTLNSGEKINLRNYLDFRPVQDSDGLYVGAPSKVFELPTPTSVLDIDAEYYQPRTDRIVANADGTLEYIVGSPGSKSYPPQTPPGSISLFVYNMGANTLDNKDIVQTKQTHRRYTMQDIGILDRKISNLQDVVSLSLLEDHTKNLKVLDDQFLDRTKSGFQVDNFGTQVLKDVDLSTSATDFKAGKVFPQQTVRNIRLIYDSDNTNNQNAIRKGDMVFPTYTEEVYVDQSTISKSFSLNEFNVQSYTGVIELSPSSDDWFDVFKEPRNVTDLGTVLNTDAVSWYNKYNWNWKGKNLDTLNVGDVTNTNKSGNTNYWLSVSAANEEVEYTGVDTYKFSSHIDTMRSNKVYFRGTGLQPNARHFVFFNGINVSDYVNTDSGYLFYSDYDSDFGDEFGKYSQHPNGTSSPLETDEFGTITGSLFIPNNDSVSFPTGEAKFEILNVSQYTPNSSFSYGAHIYSANGTLRHVTPEFTTTRVLEVTPNTKTTRPPNRNDDNNNNNSNNNNITAANLANLNSGYENYGNNSSDYGNFGHSGPNNSNDPNNHY